MRVSFSNPAFPHLEVPDSNLLAVLEPQSAAPAQSVVELTKTALDRPLGSPPLEDFISPSSRVLILVDDVTRRTPAGAILPSLFKRLAGHGVQKKNVNILIAAGTHTRMTPAEIEKKLGPRIPREHSVTVHYWKEEDKLEQIGTTADGTPVRINRLLKETDFAIGVGQIVPHRVMGFTGGASIVQPGVSGKELTGYTHWLSALYPGREILGIAENPVRLDVERIARQAGLRFIVNVVMDAHDRVVHVVAGDLTAAHRRGAELSREIYGIPLPAAADIVVAESHPAEYDLWQAAKGIYSADLAVRRGGVVILLTLCPHGVSSEHPEVEQLGYHGYADVKSMVEAGKITDLVAAAHLAHVGRVIRDKAHGIMVSPGIDPETQGHLGFEPARTPQKALKMALAIAGPNARVAVLRHGADVLPIVQTNSKTPDQPSSTT
jgi:nickel-dependent lactate racemase